MTVEIVMPGELTNPALNELEFLIGEWDMALSGASFLPDPDQVVHGRVAFEPIENGAFLIMKQLLEPSGPPAALWLIGRDEARSDFTVLYADARGVSRVYEMSLSVTDWKIWRDDPTFSQRFEATIAPDHQAIVGRWEKRSSGGTWEHDFNVTYSRL
jgi:hypothetical protein